LPEYGTVPRSPPVALEPAQTPPRVTPSNRPILARVLEEPKGARLPVPGPAAGHPIPPSGSPAHPRTPSELSPSARPFPPPGTSSGPRAGCRVPSPTGRATPPAPALLAPAPPPRRAQGNDRGGGRARPLPRRSPAADRDCIGGPSPAVDNGLRLP